MGNFASVNSIFFEEFNISVVTEFDHPSHHSRQQRVGQVGRGGGGSCRLSALTACQFLHGKARQRDGLTLGPARDGKIGAAPRADLRLAHPSTASQAALQRFYK
jgi:hypothetical protein